MSVRKGAATSVNCSQVFFDGGRPAACAVRVFLMYIARPPGPTSLSARRPAVASLANLDILLRRPRWYRAWALVCTCEGCRTMPAVLGRMNGLCFILAYPSRKRNEARRRASARGRRIRGSDPSLRSEPSVKNSLRRSCRFRGTSKIRRERERLPSGLRGIQFVCKDFLFWPAASSSVNAKDPGSLRSVAGPTARLREQLPQHIESA